MKRILIVCNNYILRERLMSLPENHDELFLFDNEFTKAARLDQDETNKFRWLNFMLDSEYIASENNIQQYLFVCLSNKDSRSDKQAISLIKQISGGETRIFVIRFDMEDQKPGNIIKKILSEEISLPLITEYSDMYPMMEIVNETL